jgi:hypothetical protein
MCHANCGRLGPVEKETVENEPGKEKSEWVEPKNDL